MQSRQGIWHPWRKVQTSPILYPKRGSRAWRSLSGIRSKERSLRNWGGSCGIHPCKGPSMKSLPTELGAVYHLKGTFCRGGGTCRLRLACAGRGRRDRVNPCTLRPGFR